MNEKLEAPLSTLSISNLLRVLTVGICAFLLSVFYYSSLVFGPIWNRYRSKDAPPPNWTFAFAPLREIIVSFVLLFLIQRLSLVDWKKSTGLILLLWFAFHAVGMAGAVLFDNMAWQLGLVHAGDWLMKMILMGIVLTLWNKSGIQKYK